MRALLYSPYSCSNVERDFVQYLRWHRLGSCSARPVGPTRAKSLGEGVTPYARFWGKAVCPWASVQLLGVLGMVLGLWVFGSYYTLQ